MHARSLHGFGLGRSPRRPDHPKDIRGDQRHEQKTVPPTEPIIHEEPPEKECCGHHHRPVDASRVPVHFNREHKDAEAQDETDVHDVAAHDIADADGRIAMKGGYEAHQEFWRTGAHAHYR